MSCTAGAGDIHDGCHGCAAPNVPGEKASGQGPKIHAMSKKCRARWWQWITVSFIYI